MADSIDTPEALLEALRAALFPLADALRAEAMSAYMRHRFTFLGIPTPARRQAVQPLIRAFRGDLLAAARRLWAEEPREMQYVACDLLRRHASRLAADQLPALEALVTQKSWWDTVDTLAVVVGEVVRRHPNLAVRMDELIAADDFWLRRIALLHQLAWKQETDEARLFRYCLRCTGEKEFFIQKAIGWALRQYARVAPGVVAGFVEAHRGELAPLSVREATKHL